MLVTFATALGNEPVNDDWQLVVDNPYLRTVSGLGVVLRSELWEASAVGERSMYYRPLAMLSFFVNGQLGGYSAASFRFGNIVLHAANVAMLALLARRLLPRLATHAAWLGALLWGVLPVNSEPVFWIAGRFDLLAVSFSLLSLLVVLSRHRAGSLLLLLFACGGLLSKESFVVVIPLLMLAELLLARRPARARCRRAGLVAMAVGGYLALRLALAIPWPVAPQLSELAPLAQAYAFQVGSLSLASVWFQTLDLYRPYLPLPLGASLAVLALALVVTIATGRAALRAPQGAVVRVAWFGWLWFWVTLLPSTRVGPDLGIVGDRYAYLPLSGMLLVVLSGRHLLARAEPRVARLGRLFSQKSQRLGVALGLGLLCLVAAAATAARGKDWRSDRSLAQASLRAHPGGHYAMYLLGYLAAEQGDLGAAERYVLGSLGRRPESWKAWNALCFIRLRQSRLEQAIGACQRCLRLRPESSRAWVNLASVHVKARRWPAASQAAERATALVPRYAEARYLAALAAANLGQLSRAKAHVSVGLASDPSHPRLQDLRRQLAGRATVP